MKRLILLLAISFVLLTLSSPSLADLRILTLEEAPTNYTDGGTLVGMVTDIVKRIQEEVGDTTEICVWPPARVIDALTCEPDTVAFTLGKTEDRIRKGFQFLGPVTTRKHVLWKVRGSHVSVSSDSDVLSKRYRVGCIPGDWRTKYYTDKNIEVVTAKDHAANLKKLLRGRIDLWVSSDLEGSVLVKDHFISMDDIEVALVIREAPSFIVFSKGTSPELIQSWTGAFDRLKETDFFDKTARKWSGILDVEVTFDPDTGFVINTD